MTLDAKMEDARWALGLRRFREAAKMTQLDLANAAGFPGKTSVCELETERRAFTRSTLLRLGVVMQRRTTAAVIAELERRASDDTDADLIDEDPVCLTEEAYQAAMRDLADGEATWKGLALRRRHQLEAVNEMLDGGDVDGARRYLAELLAPVGGHGDVSEAEGVLHG